MPTAFGHVVASFTLTYVGGAVTGGPGHKEKARFGVILPVLAVLSGVVPDLDSIGFKLGIPYGDLFGHRGFSHSILFAVLWSVLLTAVFFRKRPEWIRIFLVLLLSVASHDVLDAFTNGGLGVGFFIPFDDKRYFFPFRPIEVSPISPTRFFHQAFGILSNEMLWIGVPCLGILAITGVVSAFLRRGEGLCRMIPRKRSPR